jgi:hypothetical protein
MDYPEDMTHTEVRRLARIGAEARLQTIQREMAAILQVFPDLRSGQTASAERDGHATVGTISQRRRRPKMSAEGRKRIAEAQRKRWAEWRKKTKGSTGNRAPIKATERPQMSPARRRAISDRMRKYWTARRKETTT